MRCVKFCLSTIAAVATALTVTAAPGSAPQKIGTLEATNFFGKEMTVTGTVAQVSIRPKIVFLNIDKPYPDSPFTLVIFPAATNQFGNLKALRGMSIEATGVVTNFHDRVEMVLERSNQLRVIGAKAP